MSGIDATIIIAYLLAMVGVGVWFMHRNKSADDFFGFFGIVACLVVAPLASLGGRGKGVAAC